MIRKKKCIAMLLAGGQGSRLYALTNKLAKPAVSFGGKYRIIDFPLSNCVNSGIDTVGVLTQYQPLVLNDYIGNGQPWDLDRLHGGVHVLPPYQQASGSDWYKGTANAIYQNLGFIDRYQPEYVLILSGDHIYKMDYEVMLDFHKANNADVTIALQAPKLRPHIDTMRKTLAEVMGVEIDRGSVKATTTERLGFVGRGEGCEVWASASIFKEL